MKTKLILITGLSGTGKTTLANYFIENPIKGWVAFDFDKGKVKIPMFDNKKQQDEQLNWWLNVARNQWEVNGLGTIIFGFWGFPEKLNNIKLFKEDEMKLAWLHADLESMNMRCEIRNTPDLKKLELKDWQIAFQEYLESNATKKFDTSVNDIKTTVRDIKDWIRILS